MCLRFCGMSPNPFDFGSEQSDPGIKLGLRKRVERLGGQPTGKVARGARSLFKFHCTAQCGASALAVNRVHG